VNRSNTPARDPNDIPFINVAKRTKAVGIVTTDKDIAAMGGQVVAPETVRDIRDYARSTASQIGLLKMGGL
jgi:predicted nucleic acid-binding protein